MSRRPCRWSWACLHGHEGLRPWRNGIRFTSVVWRVGGGAGSTTRARLRGTRGWRERSGCRRVVGPCCRIQRNQARASFHATRSPPGRIGVPRVPALARHGMPRRRPGTRGRCAMSAKARPTSPAARCSIPATSTATAGTTSASAPAASCCAPRPFSPRDACTWCPAGDPVLTTRGIDRRSRARPGARGPFEGFSAGERDRRSCRCCSVRAR